MMMSGKGGGKGGKGWGGGKGSWGGGRKLGKPLPDGTTINKEARYQGTVKKWKKFGGSGWVELSQKGVIPDDQVFVYWKSLKSDDRFPQLKQDMSVELGLHPYKSKKT